MNILIPAPADLDEALTPCQGLDPDLWFEETPEATAQAQSACASCPIRASCLAQALVRREEWGIWGGEIFEGGRLVAQRTPTGRPRLDADELLARASAELASRLAALVRLAPESSVGPITGALNDARLVAARSSRCAA